MAHITLSLVTLVVPDYDLAIDYFTNKLGFILVCDKVVSATKRWVVVRPGSTAWKAAGKSCQPRAERRDRLPDRRQNGVFLNTDDFAADYARLSKNGVKFCERPRYEPYGIVAKFHDLFGNTWDLLQRAKNQL